MLAAGAAYADQDLSVKVWFPDNPTGEFVPGKVSKAVFGLHNVDATACNVSYAGASLALPYDASSSIFNFSSSVGGVCLGVARWCDGGPAALGAGGSGRGSAIQAGARRRS